MKNFNDYIDNKDLCSWCFDEIVTEVYVLALNKTYCRDKCMVSDIQWARSFVRDEEEEKAINAQFNTSSTQRLCI